MTADEAVRGLLAIVDEREDLTIPEKDAIFRAIHLPYNKRRRSKKISMAHAVLQSFPGPARSIKTRLPVREPIAWSWLESDFRSETGARLLETMRLIVTFGVVIDPKAVKPPEVEVTFSDLNGLFKSVYAGHLEALMPDTKALAATIEGAEARWWRDVNHHVQDHIAMLIAGKEKP